MFFSLDLHRLQIRFLGPKKAVTIIQDIFKWKNKNSTVHKTISLNKYFARKVSFLRDIF